MWWKEKWNENEMKWKMKKWIANQIGYEGAKTISESLMINTSLTSLDLGCDEKIWNEMREYNEREMINE